LVGGHNSRTCSLDFGQLFNLDFIDFLHVFFYSFLTTFSAYKIYATIPPINTPLNLHHFLKFSPSSSHSFTFIVFVFFIAFLGANLGVKKGQRRGENRPTDLGHKEVNPWGKSNLLLFTPKTFYRG